MTGARRLSGPRVALLPVPVTVAAAVVAGDPARVGRELRAHGLCPAAGWPHEDTAAALRPLAEHGAAEGDGTWLVADGEQVIGDCGWHGGPGPDGDVELGYGLAPGSRGQGLGTEAVALLAAWAEQQPGIRLLTAQVLVGNEASLRLLARLGFVEEHSRPPHLRLVRAVPGRPARRLRGRHVC